MMKENAKTSLYSPVIVKKEVNSEHYYYVDGQFFPGVTTILHETLPTPMALRSWIGDVGNEKAQLKLERAADRGTKIHAACESLLRGESVNLDIEFPDRNDKKCVAAFVNWASEFNPDISKGKIEFVVASQLGFAGTLDIFCYIDDQPWIVDIKTSTGVYDSHKLQVVAYQQAFYEMTGIKANMAILHLNFRTKKGYSFIKDISIGGRELIIGDFVKVFEVYKMLNGGKIPEPPLDNIYPSVISLCNKEVT